MLDGNHFEIPRYCSQCGEQITTFGNVSNALYAFCDKCQERMLSGQSFVNFTPESSIGILKDQTNFQYGILKDRFSFPTIQPPDFLNDINVAAVTLGQPSDLSKIFNGVGDFQRDLLGSVTVGPNTLDPGVISVADATQKISDLFLNLASGEQVVTKLTDPAYSGWLKYSDPDVVKLSTNAAAQMSGVLGTSIAATNSLLAVDAIKLFALAGDNEGMGRLLVNTLSGMAVGYSDLVSDRFVNPEIVLNSSPLFIERPSIEMYQAGVLANAIAPLEYGVPLPGSSIPTVIKIATDVRGKMLTLGQAYVDMYEGAAEAINRQSKDSQRQGCASLRELMTHTLHTLAPDEPTIEYLNQLGKPEQYLRQGRPTRKGRLKYITRNIDDEDFEEFLDKDITAALAYFDLLQQGTHALVSPYTESQAQAILHRGEGLVSYLIEISMY